MLTSIIAILVLIFFAFFIIRKREMLIRVFSLNVSGSANEFQSQLEQTADIVLRRLDNQISHLEYLLAEAEDKIRILENQLEHAKKIVEQTGSATQFKLLEAIENTEQREANNDEVDKNVVIAEADNFVKNSLIQDQSIKTMSKETISDDKRRLIIAMSEQGYNLTEIAKATGIGKGAIMLVLQLNKK